MFGQYFGIARTQVKISGQLLGRFAPEVLQIGFGSGACAFFVDYAVHDGNRRFGKNGVAWIDDFKLVLGQLFADVVGLIFKGNQNITDMALAEGRRCRAAAVFKHRRVFQQCGHKIFGFAFIAVIHFQTITVRTQKGVAAVAGGFRVGQNDLHAVFGQIAPVLDVFRIAFAHQENDVAGIRHGIIRQARVPIVFNQAFFHQKLDIGSLVHGDHIGGQTVGHGQSLLAGAAVRLLDFNRCTAVFRSIFFDKQRIVFFIKISCDIIRDVQQLHITALACGSGIVGRLFVFGRAGTQRQRGGQCSKRKGTDIHGRLLLKVWRYFIGIGGKREIMFAFGFISFGYINRGRLKSKNNYL